MAIKALSDEILSPVVDNSARAHSLAAALDVDPRQRHLAHLLGSASRAHVRRRVDRRIVGDRFGHQRGRRGMPLA
jgi:hypothetical protein